MYIDTYSENSMKEGICDYFDISEKELYSFFDEIKTITQTGNYFDERKFDEIINEFINDKKCSIYIDQILFFHLSRRLNSMQDCFISNNLYELLSTKNGLTDFLKEYDVEFLKFKGYLELKYKGKIISLDDKEAEYIPYLRWRLGYDKDDIDFCVNGFLMKDLLYTNRYAHELSQAPEFVKVLAGFLERQDMITDYIKNSRYYCFKYLIPIDKVFFDYNDKLSKDEKQQYLLNQILHRLYDYRVRENVFDYDNPILRLSDNDTIKKEYFISREEITLDMLT